MTDQERQWTNETRNKQIDKIEQIKEFNLHEFKMSKLDEDGFKAKWSYVLNDPSLNNEQRLDMLRKDLILNDCIILEGPIEGTDSNNNSTNMASLLITDFYFSTRENLEFLK